MKYTKCKLVKMLPLTRFPFVSDDGKVARTKELIAYVNSWIAATSGLSSIGGLAGGRSSVGVGAVAIACNSCTLAFFYSTIDQIWIFQYDIHN
jgi:hypothetical protein